MAYYQDAPGKRKKINYAQTGSWDEEGSHYRNRNRQGESRKDGRPGGRRNEGGSMGRPEGRRTGPGAYRRSGDKEGPRPTGRRFGTTDDRRPGSERDRRPEPRRSRPTANPRPEWEQEREKGYRDFEYCGRPEEDRDRRAPGRDFADRGRPEENRDEGADRILCGRNPIREALRGGREIEKLLIQKGELNGTAREIVQEAREKKIMVQEVDRRRLDEIALHHQGLIAFASEYAYAEIDEMIAAAEAREEEPFLVILDGVTDPHNLGAIIRTAECAGAHGVIIPTHRSVGLTPAAVKASAGAIEHMKVARVTNLNRTIEDLKKAGIWVYAVTMDGKDYEKVDFRGGVALVVGAEGEGISRLTEEKCDLKVSLPMKGQLDSLNASVAAGIIMYRVLSCRRKQG